jgi:hypothetical protein
VIQGPRGHWPRIGGWYRCLRRAGPCKQWPAAPFGQLARESVSPREGEDELSRFLVPSAVGGGALLRGPIGIKLSHEPALQELRVAEELEGRGLARAGHDATGGLTPAGQIDEHAP